MESNVGHNFLQLVDKHFPKGSRLHKYFNRNSIKVSYCCLGNMSTIISGHNKKILKSSETKEAPQGKCKCTQDINTCPVEGKCFLKDTVYEALVTSTQKVTSNSITKNVTISKKYLGATEQKFKNRHNFHLSTFRHRHLSSSSCLSKYIWSLKDSGTMFDIKWRILRQVPSYTKEAKKCNLCLTEKTLILFGDKRDLINHRSEILNKCRHSNKYKLKKC